MYEIDSRQDNAKTHFNRTDPADIRQDSGLMFKVHRPVSLEASQVHFTSQAILHDTDSVYMTSVALAGCTGQVGSNILSILANHPAVSGVHALSRRELPTSSPKVKSVVASNASTWSSLCPNGVPLFISALGTTRAVVGSFANQYRIDHDLNLELAKAAKQAGATTYVLISSAGADSRSFFNYPRMKGELEEAVKALGFEHTVIVRPGMIVGARVKPDTAELLLRKLAGAAGMVSTTWLKDFWAQDSAVIAKAAINAGLQCVEGKVDCEVWLLSQSEIVRLGRREWALAP